MGYPAVGMLGQGGTAAVLRDAPGGPAVMGGRHGVIRYRGGEAQVLSGCQAVCGQPAGPDG
jgi:hypothetical protein